MTIKEYIYPRPPKYMCLSCFRIFSKRYQSDGVEPYGATKRCTCGNEELKRLDPNVPIPRKKANNRKWWEFFRKQFWMTMTARTYYKRFRELRENT